MARLIRSALDRNRNTKGPHGRIVRCIWRAPLLILAKRSARDMVEPRYYLPCVAIPNHARTPIFFFFLDSLIGRCYKSPPQGIGNTSGGGSCTERLPPPILSHLESPPFSAQIQEFIPGTDDRLSVGEARLPVSLG